MSDPERQTVSKIRQLLERAGLKPRHDLGQNFLIDLNLLDVIVAAADLSPDDVILEVGTGTGTLTARLAAQARQVIAVEFDQEMAKLTADSVSGQTNVTLLNQDVLKNKNHLADEVLDTIAQVLQSTGGRTLKLVANLPYHVATPVISNLVATELPWTRMVVTIQKELAERLVAAPSTPDYSALSIWLQAQCRIEILRRLPPSVFWPKPKVDSAIVQIDRDRTRQARLTDRPAFQQFVRDVFTQRRKHLLGVVAKLLTGTVDRVAIEQVQLELGWPPETRAEELSVDQFVTYFERIHGLANVKPGSSLD